MKRYRQISKHIRLIFKLATDQIEPLSLDEAYLDVTTNKLGKKYAKDIAVFLKKRIKRETGLTASAGVGPNKLVAKIASDLQKPNGLVVVHPEKVRSFLAELPIEKLWGVGPARAKQLHRSGFIHIRDIQKKSLDELRILLGNFGEYVYKLSQGKDERVVSNKRIRKSQSTETTFSEDIKDPKVLQKYLRDFSNELSATLAKRNEKIKTVTLKLRFDNFETITRSKSSPSFFNQEEDIFLTAIKLLNLTQADKRPVRLLGLGVSNYYSQSFDAQMKLF